MTSLKVKANTDRLIFFFKKAGDIEMVCKEYLST